VNCGTRDVRHLYMYGIKRVRDWVANTVVFWPSWQHGCELNLRGTSQLLHYSLSSSLSLSGLEVNAND
jgi:hypothetical protein